MRARFDTLFGRLFGVLLIAIILAHLLAFSGFTITARRPLRHRPGFPRASTASVHRWTHVSPIGRLDRGSAGRWCR